MTTDPESSPESTKAGSKFKLTLVQGVIGAVSLAGTTAIPIVVQRVLSPAPIVSPSPEASVQVAPAQVQPTNSPIASPDVSEADDKKKGKKKGKKD